MLRIAKRLQHFLQVRGGGAHGTNTDDLHGQLLWGCKFPANSETYWALVSGPTISSVTGAD